MVSVKVDSKYEIQDVIESNGYGLDLIIKTELYHTIVIVWVYYTTQVDDTRPEAGFFFVTGPTVYFWRCCDQNGSGQKCHVRASVHQTA